MVVFILFIFSWLYKNVQEFLYIKSFFHLNHFEGDADD